MKTYTVIISIDPSYYYWHIPRYIHVGEKLYAYLGITYGCVSPEGVAVTLKYNTTPFFEVPLTHIKETLDVS